uniref:Uncharacterized protein n=1 Tax=Chromera velia CCMP2878 TaxID=1169474 RepID=A0A0G4FSG1_9ALVE|eukprot:Cvel_18544.t1-p1 / transcript=Cvel_18544.t1 / gene=Cvel_18544 / organism=Chromera_velia_CCMP2878 / gene_product=hypothetical protein / transcript_product=hypothetical protein / location=Cvel_scaffold1543:43054-43608(+) / protein_length=69 / sequence_SO=supercontig / SO=protein_coding / is_pseudo=false
MTPTCLCLRWQEENRRRHWNGWRCEPYEASGECSRECKERWTEKSVNCSSGDLKTNGTGALWNTRATTE